MVSIYPDRCNTYSGTIISQEKVFHFDIDLDDSIWVDITTGFVKKRTGQVQTLGKNWLSNSLKNYLSNLIGLPGKVFFIRNSCNSVQLYNEKITFK